MASRQAVLSLYRNLMRESKKWNSYNYREYALRKVKHEFKVNRSISDVEELTNIYNKGLQSLEMIKRQVTVGNLYSTKPLIIEARTAEGKTQACVK